MAGQVQLFEPLRDFEARLPERPYCSGSKSFAFIRPKEQAKRLPYIQVNYPAISYLCFDYDREWSEFQTEEVDIPGPTLSVVNPDNGHAHLFYQILDPIPRYHSAKTSKLLDDVIFAYNLMLRADRCITAQKQLVKNALSPMWEVKEGYKPFTLSELAEYIPHDLAWVSKAFEKQEETLTVKPFEETLDPGSRNCSLFDSARLYAYSVVSEHGSYESLFSDVLDHIHHLNDEEIPKYFPEKILSLNELKHTAKSVAGFTWDNRSRFRGVDNGAMGFEPIEGLSREEYEAEVKRRRRLSAERTHDLMREETRKKLLRGVYLCLKRGLELTPGNIGAAARVSRKSVYRHIDFVRGLIREVSES